MIAVQTNDDQFPIVREFFELFKTPWESYRAGSNYDVLICSNAELPDTAARLVLIYGNEQTNFDRENRIEILSRRRGRVLLHQGDRIPIYGNSLAFAGPGQRLFADESTHEVIVSEIASPKQTFLRAGFDLFEEIHHLLTQGQPVAWAAVPTLELHVALLRSLIVNSGIPLVEIPPIPANYSFIACLTHDVDHARIRNHKFDHTMFGFLCRALVGSVIDFFRGRKSLKQVGLNWLAAFSLPLVHLGLLRDFWLQFDRYLKIEEGLASTFFVIPRKSDPGRTGSGMAPARRATRYDLSEIAPQLGRLISAGCEIGLHGIDSWRDSDAGSAEMKRIRHITGAKEMGVRMHWLYFDERSPARLDQSGFSYDSTVGYNETVGFRAGATQAFKPLSAERMLELPLHIMDTALFYSSYMNLSAKQAEKAVAPLIDDVARFGGALTINWHDRSLAPDRLWDGFYVRLLEKLKRRGAWFPTALHAVTWFRKRRAALIENVSFENDAVRVSVSLPGNNDDNTLPGLRVRVHRAHSTATDAGAAHPNFNDIVVNSTGNFAIAL
jgi:hypothetical protein